METQKYQALSLNDLTEETLKKAFSASARLASIKSRQAKKGPGAITTSAAAYSSGSSGEKGAPPTPGQKTKKVNPVTTDKGNSAIGGHPVVHNVITNTGVRHAITKEPTGRFRVHSAPKGADYVKGKDHPSLAVAKQHVHGKVAAEGAARVKQRESVRAPSLARRRALDSLISGNG